MATLYEYFIRDGAQKLTTQEVWSLAGASGKKLGDLTARLHSDFDAHACYISFFIPDMPDVACPEAFVLNKIKEILDWPKKIVVQAGIGGEMKDGRDLVFTGQIYLYSERPVPDELITQLSSEADAIGHRLAFRSNNYMNERNKWEKPKAFISHDSRDKQNIAEPLALQLQKFFCPVWFDKFSLQVGDSLRESIERGLKECPKCIFVLTPNFLSNGGWSKREYDSIFTRELIEQQKVILPVWYNVSVEDVYKYSPMLADRFGAQWSEGVEEVARQLVRVIDFGTV